MTGGRTVDEVGQDLNEAGASGASEVFFASVRTATHVTAPREILSMDLPAGDYVLTSTLTSSANLAADEGVAGVASMGCRIRDRDMPSVLNLGEGQWSGDLTITSAIHHQGGQVALQCWADGDGQFLKSASLLATKATLLN